MGESNHEESVASEIRRYLVAHPLACDSATGVQRWWLAPDVVEPTLEVVQRALDRLVAAGELVGRTLGDGRTLYSAGRGGKTRE